MIEVSVCQNNNELIQTLKFCLKESTIIQEIENNFNTTVREWHYRNHALYSNI